MTAQVPRLPFSLHALVAEAKRRARRRRVLLAIVAIALGGGGAGAVYATHPFGWLESSSATAADYQQGGVAVGSGGPPSFSSADLSSVSALSRTSAWTLGSVAWQWDGSGWRAVPLPPAGRAMLNAVAAVAPDDVWAVGESGQGQTSPLVEHWNGMRWSVVGIPHFSFAALSSVSVVGPRNVWALGMAWDPAQPLLLHWNGHRWLRQAVPWYRDGVELGKIVATGSSSVWILSEGSPSILEHWDGSQWQAVPQPFGEHDPIGDFSATGWNDAWAVGSYRTGPSRGYGYSHPLAAHWDGSTWTITPVPDVRGHNDTELDSVAAAGRHDAWAIGQSQHLELGDHSVSAGGLQALLVHWDGRRWSITPGSGLAGVNPHGITVAKDGSAWAVGDCGNDSVVLGWNGASWKVVPHPRDLRWNADVPASQRRRLKSCASGASGS